MDCPGGPASPRNLTGREMFLEVTREHTQQDDRTGSGTRDTGLAPSLFFKYVLKYLFIGVTEGNREGEIEREERKRDIFHLLAQMVKMAGPRSGPKPGA